MKKSNRKEGWVLILMCSVVTSCTSRMTYAPVVEQSVQVGTPAGFYRVEPGDTLYSVAWGYGLDYRTLAKVNHLQAPYRIYPGQKIRTIIHSQEKSLPSLLLATQEKSVHIVNKTTKKMVYLSQWRKQNAPAAPLKTATGVAPHWIWPVRGPIVDHFDNSLAGNKGINIAGRYGEPVKTSAKGIVVYSGDGVRGYGNLVIVKHSDSYLSAYAFNKRILVKEGARVREGQVIAEMGRDDAGRVMLHFEIRRNGQPVNPLSYLS